MPIIKSFSTHIRAVNLLLIIIFTFSWSGLFGQESDYTIYLIGETASIDPNDPVLNSLENILSVEKDESLVLFLGDITSSGMPDSSTNSRGEVENLINSHLRILENFGGSAILIPGEGDWSNGKKDGWDKLSNLQRYIEEKDMDHIQMIPSGGCPGPEIIHLDENIVLITLDLQWLLHPYAKPGVDSDCDAKEPAELLFKFKDALEKNKGKQIIIASHHPAFSYGPHGTRALGNMQDLSHPVYKSISREFERALKPYPEIIHVSAHDHSIQYIKRNNNHYLVSGSIGKTTKVSDGKDAVYVNDARGFIKIDLNKYQNIITFNTFNGETFEEDHRVEVDVASRQKIAVEPDIKRNFSDSSVVVHASDRYDKRKSIYWLIGQNYRDLWGTDLEVRVFDISNEKGGLEIVKRGGGFQTNSLRLEASDGRQYVLRSIEKYPERAAIPELLLETFAADVIKDQISAAHPYGAFVIPDLADAAGIYHTNPELVWVPDDPAFGEYREDFANGLYLFEERPDDDVWEDNEDFGKPDDILSTSKLIEELKDDNDHYVDQEWVVRSRLFDVWIGDWDRHDDQWRWAEFDKKGGKMYRPIPRDRDQAFFVNEGFLMSIVKKKWAEPKFQGFDYDIKYPEGFIYNARYFDRHFMNELSRDDWIEAAEELQQKLTDEVIESAIRKWPDPIYKKSGKEVISKLKSQRENLKKYAIEIYEFLAKEVDVLGTDKKEYFKVERLNDEDTRVRVYKKTKDDRKDEKIYDRTFKTSETKEIRLYGFKKDDDFEITGRVNKGILIRVIGGKGDDVIIDESVVRGLSKKTRVYDTKSGSKIHFSEETKDKTSKSSDVNRYNRRSFNYNKLAPLIIGNINADDGLFLGGGFFYRDHGFRKDPYKSEHLLLGSVAFETLSWQFSYKASFIDVFGDLDLELDIHALAPNYTTNFFGFGNESVFNKNAEDVFNVGKAIDYYRTRYEDYGAEILLKYDISEKTFISFGISPRAFEAESGYDGEDRFILDNATIISENDIFKWRSYMGGVVKLEIDKRDKRAIPNRGYLLEAAFKSFAGLNSLSDEYGTVNASFSYYSTVIPNRLTFATKFSGGHTFGEFEFYQSQVLDGNTELRGYRKTRFYGDSKLYNNTELRLKLFYFKNRIAPGSVGLSVFNDTGRVWFEGESSDTWHHGYGGGAWIAPLNLTVLGVDIGHSKEGTLAYFRFGFMF